MLEDIKKSQLLIAVTCIFTSIVISFVSIIYVQIITYNPDIPDLLEFLSWVFLLPITWICIAMFSIVLYFYSFNYKTINDFIYRYRYIISFMLFVMCVFLELNGSSIGMWCSWFGEQDRDIIIGSSRAIRSDEWAVSTPMALSQYNNYSGAFPYYSDTVRACPTDVFLEYGQPVLNPLIVFRPFYIGFLFLPPAMGLSFFWCGRMIALFLVSFEFGMLIADRQKGLALLSAFMIAFSPVVQWWFAINGLVEMLIYLQLSILALRKFLLTDSLYEKLACAFTCTICAGGFVLTFYPPWMIPSAYVLLAIGVWVIIDNKERMIFDKTNIAIFTLSLFLFSVSMIYLYLMSKGTIKAILGTVFPGSRKETGGGFIRYFSLYITNIWHSILGSGAVGNVCESSAFINLFPLSFALPLISNIRRKKKDVLSCCLLVINIFLGFYCIIGFSEPISKITMLAYCLANRVLVILGFSNTLLLIRYLSQKEKSISLIPSMIVSGAALTFNLLSISPLIGDYLDRYIVILISTICLFFVLYLLLLISRTGKMILFEILMISTILFSSLLTNPIRRGIDSVENLQLLNRLEEIHLQNPEDKWIVEAAYPINNFPLIKGVPVINSTNVYPNIERWRILDPNGEYDDVYNRYAHIQICLVDSSQDASFELRNPDVFVCYLPITRLNDLDVGYVMSNRDLSGYCDDGDLLFIDSVSNYYFYRVVK